MRWDADQNDPADSRRVRLDGSFDFGADRSVAPTSEIILCFACIDWIAKMHWTRDCSFGLACPIVIAMVFCRAAAELITHALVPSR